MSSFWRPLPLTVCATLLASAAYPQYTPVEQQLPCESFSQSAAVFVGVASPPVQRWVQLPNHPPLQMKLTPITVERAYVGVSTPVMYLTPLGTELYAMPGQRYLVYGREYHSPDIVAASPGTGAKEINAARADLAFLETLMPGVTGGTISGVVQLKDLTYDRASRGVTPLDRILVRITNDRYSTEAMTAEDGRFSVSVPAGTYRLVPQLPEDLVVWDSTSRIQGMTAIVADGGCTVMKIDTLFNGRVRGVVRGPDGRPLASTTVDLIPIDIEPEAAARAGGHVSRASTSSWLRASPPLPALPIARLQTSLMVVSLPQGPSLDVGRTPRRIATALSTFS
jgi:hypothetical protein